jgi:hypothetical protein
MASTIRRFQISSDTFAIENGWLQLDGPSIRVDSITSLSVVRNRDDIHHEHEARNSFAQTQHKHRSEIQANLVINFGILFFAIIIILFVSFIGYLQTNKINIKFNDILDALVSIPLIIIGLFWFGSIFFKKLSQTTSKAAQFFYGPIHTYSHKNMYEFVIDTNSSMEFFFLSSEINYLHRIKIAIEEAIKSRDSSISYHFNISTQTIEKIDANMNQVTNSPGAAIIGDNASNVHQTTNVSIQGIQDIAQLSALVEQSNAPNKALMQECLDIVRSHLAGGSSKAQAKTAWETFLANVGALAKAGGDIWSLVSRVATLVG